MAQSLVKNLVHLVFSTHNREPSLAETIRSPLCAYAAAVLRDLDSPVLAADAWRDHVHLLFSLSKNRPLAEVVMQVKRATSKWLKTTSSEFTRFHWQAGYGAFSIGQSGLEDTIVVHWASAGASSKENLRTGVSRLDEALPIGIR